MAQFKRRGGWTIERELPYDRTPPQYYMFPYEPKLDVEILMKDSEIPKFIEIHRLEFRLFDFWKDSQGNYVKAFYEEI